ncbi:MerR family transcriptional regulator [Alkaliphilus sp. MSJ-5]|uniref:MerR family transcriptional regulator n=1 Tax=Alkaliphilus flagellatus TaxID=2841507 RepID=A0ABS6G7B2_9FIRM|nr:MerR family transcriptional regulator [Alkaliphilus flagellatus]MBU5678243.1 MerR family transcriptional regulator [Alkaliphilus flagellatus]
MDSLYSINDLAQKLGISISTIRKYEQDYRLNIMRNESNNRVYTESDIEVFKKILELKSEGANIHLIRKILAKEDVAHEVPEVIEENNFNLYSIDLFQQQLIKNIDDTMTKKVNSLKEEFDIILDKKLEEQGQRIREQIKAENQELIHYIENYRKEKKSIWTKLFKK